MKKLYQAEFTAEKKRKDQITDELFEAGAMSVSVSDTDNDTQIKFSAIFNDPACIKEGIKSCCDLLELDDSFWKYRWFEDYRGFKINDDIFVCPFTGSVDEGDCYRHVIYLDPRDAFGDGRHPTTFMCINILYEVLSGVDENTREAITLADLGTGTGILSVLAGLMGVRAIHAIDINMDSVTMFKRNMELNSVSFDSVQCCDIAAYNPGTQFDIVIANLLTDVLIANMEKLHGMVNPGGTLIISGISSQWNDEIEGHLTGRGFRVMEKSEREGWLAFLAGRK